MEKGEKAMMLMRVRSGYMNDSRLILSLHRVCIEGTWKLCLVYSHHRHLEERGKEQDMCGRNGEWERGQQHVTRGDTGNR